MQTQVLSSSIVSITELGIDLLASLCQILCPYAKEGHGRVRQSIQCYSTTGASQAYIGVLNIVFATGSAAGASLGGYIADSLGWRWLVPLSIATNPLSFHRRSFLLQVPIALFAIVSVSWTLELPLKDLADFATGIRRVDFGGAITLVLAVFFLLFGLDRGGNDSWSDHITIASLTGALAFFVLFSIIELELAAEPFAPRRIIVNRSLIASYLVNLFGIASGFTVLFHAPLYLQAVLNKTASEVGKWLVLSVAGSLFGSLGGGLFIQATGKYFWLTFLAYITMLVGTVAVLLASGWWITSAIVLAIGTPLIHPRIIPTF